MKPVYINSLSIAAPGLIGLEQATPVLQGKQPWQKQDFPKLAPQLLPANERRRMTNYIKLAITVADEACLMDKNLNAVFASSYGDLSVVDHICNTLCASPKYISPTQFHNSVHNAPSGYWAIAAKAKAPSTSLSTGDSTFSSGLLEAVTQVLTLNKDVLLVAYDYPATTPLDKCITINEPFATAFVLSLNKTDHSYGTVQLEVDTTEKQKSVCKNLSLNDLQISNPIADCLPLLEAFCLKSSNTVYLPYLNNNTLKVVFSQ